MSKTKGRSDRPLQCRRCKMAGIPKSNLRIERGVQRRIIGGKQRYCVTVTCANGHEFWSVHPDAIARSRKRDERAREKAAIDRAGGIVGG